MLDTADSFMRAESLEHAAVRGAIPPANLVVSTGRIKFNKPGVARKDVQVQVYHVMIDLS